MSIKLKLGLYIKPKYGLYLLCFMFWKHGQGIKECLLNVRIYIHFTSCIKHSIVLEVLNQLSLQQRRIGNKSRIGLAVKAQGDHKISPVGNNISSLLSRKGQEPFYFITKIPRRTFTKVESLDKEQ